MSGPLLEARSLDAHYGDFQALFAVDLSLAERELLALIGANGAGKSTCLRALAGLMPCASEAVRFDGRPIGGWPSHRVVHEGISLVPEGRRLFPSLSVEENLRVGAHSGRRGPWTLQRVYELFPALHDRRRSPSTTLSGGQQQMVAIGRALMSNPRVLLCDEVSLGLAPRVVHDIYASLPAIRAEGVAVVIVEQDIAQALSVADRVVCLQEGRVSLEGAPDVLSRERIARAYFGV
ncbi:MAG: ABC transporter ATP-binding protein [Burkholderiales bacterium]|jgi:branched-chain amino acid transport system ATP-binding protein|nr:MAG: ABC transporter ATP-binding protein [Burkholderiales bacterium]